MPHPELTLERRIDAELCGLDAKMCVYADDLHGHVVERGADDEFESASTIKIYILGCLYAQAEAGKASLDAELTYEARHFVDGSGLIRSLGEGARLRARDVATLMIVVSDNIATNMLIDYLGLDTINAFIRSIGCTHTKLHRSLRSDNWSEKLGTITPRDMGRFFALLAKGELVSPPGQRCHAQCVPPAALQHHAGGQHPPVLHRPRRIPRGSGSDLCSQQKRLHGCLPQ